MKTKKQRLPRKLKKRVKKLYKAHSCHWRKRMRLALLVNYKELLALDWGSRVLTAKNFKDFIELEPIKMPPIYCFDVYPYNLGFGVSFLSSAIKSEKQNFRA